MASGESDGPVCRGRVLLTGGFSAGGGEAGEAGGAWL